MRICSWLSLPRPHSFMSIWPSSKWKIIVIQMHKMAMQCENSKFFLFHSIVFFWVVEWFDSNNNNLPHRPNGIRCRWCHFSQQRMSLGPLKKTMIPMLQTILAVAQWNKSQWLTQWAKFSSTIVDASSCIVSISSFCVVFLVHSQCLLSENVQIIHYFNVVSVLARAAHQAIFMVLLSGFQPSVLR